MAGAAGRAIGCATAARSPLRVLLPILLLALPISAAHGQGTGYLIPSPGKENVQAKPRYECGTPGAPIVTLDTQSKYKQSDAQRAMIDEEAEEAYSEAVEPLRDYGRNLAKIANAYVKSSPRNTAAAACALVWLDAWASANAMTDMRSKQALFNLGQALGGFALAYLQIRNAPGLADEPKKRVESWLKILGRDVVEAKEAAQVVSWRNNHRYWAGLAATAAGIASGDRSLADWGIASARIGLAQITPEGTLPLELKRGKRARDYHIYAAEPLVATAELARSRGLNLYAEQSGALSRLVNRVVLSLDDPSFFDQAAGTRQEPYPGDGAIPGNRIAWLEIYQSRFPSQAIEAVLAPKRPVASSAIGGNTTLLFHGRD